MNVKNDDMIDANRKLTEEIRRNDEECMEKCKVNRELKEKII